MSDTQARMRRSGDGTEAGMGETVAIASKAQIERAARAWAAQSGAPLVTIEETAMWCVAMETIVRALERAGLRIVEGNGNG